MVLRASTGNFYFEQVCQRLIDGGEVLVHHRLATLAISFADGIFDSRDRLFLGQNIADSKETGLHDGIDTRAHARFTRDFVAINHMEFQLAVNNFFLDGARQLVPNIIWPKGAVQKKCCAGLGVFQEVEPLQKRKLMASDKVGAGNEIAGANGPRPEAKVRRRH